MEKLRRFIVSFTFKDALLRSFILALLCTAAVAAISGAPFLSTVDADTANQLLATTAQVMGGVLTIVFTISALAVTVVADRYSSQLLARVLSDRLTVTSFLVLLSITMVSIVAIGMETPMYQAGFLGMVLFSCFGAGLLIHFLFQTLLIINPGTLAQQLSKECITALKSQDTDEFFRLVSSLGDIALKAIHRGEEEIATEYLKALHTSHLSWLAASPRPVHLKDQAQVLFGFGLRSPVVNQYERVFKELLSRHDDNLTSLIESLSEEGIRTLMQSNGEVLALKGLISQHQELLALAIDHRNSSRFRFVHAYRDWIWGKSATEDYETVYRHECLDAFVAACREIMKHDDAELWDHTLHFFRGGYDSISSLYGNLRQDIDDLYYLLSRQETLDNWRWLLSWERWILALLAPWPTHRRLSLFKIELAGITDSLPDDHQAHQIIQRIDEDAFKLNVTAALVQAFFRIAIDALGMEKASYLETLWRHGSSTAYLDLVPAELGFVVSLVALYSQYPAQLYSGRADEALVQKCAFLYFASGLQKAAEREWMPSLPPFTARDTYRYGEWSLLFSDEIRSRYQQLILLEWWPTRILEQHDAILAETAKWEGLFDGTAESSLAEAREWLVDPDRINRWKGRADSLIRFLPIAVSRRVRFFNETRQAYESASKVREMVTTVEAEDNNARLEQICCQLRYEKKALTLLGEPHDSQSAIGFLTTELARREVTHVVQTIAEDPRVHRESIEILTLEDLQQAVRMVRQSGHQPQVFLVSENSIRAAWNHDNGFRQALYREGSRGTLTLDATLSLQLLTTNQVNGYVFVIDKAFGHWSQPQPVTPLIEPDQQDGFHIVVGVEEEVQFEIVNPDAIFVMEIQDHVVDSVRSAEDLPE